MYSGAVAAESDDDDDALDELPRPEDLPDLDFEG
jgi:hypothetical protein